MDNTGKQPTFSDVIRTSPLVLVDFYAEWCGPCRMMTPVLENLKPMVGENVKILKVDVDKNPKAAAVYRITGVPTLLLFKDGQVVWREAGVVQAVQLKKIIDQFRLAS